MKPKILATVIFILSFVITNSLFSQAKSIEERLSDLEKRVQMLEAKLGASQTSTKSEIAKPTEDIINASIKAFFKKGVPGTWAGSVMGGSNASIERIEIKEIGNYNDRGRYWHVKCKVKASCDAEFIGTTKRNSFDKIGEFMLKQDDYGKWYADLDAL